ncbi:MAG: hypothetical protein AAFZ63_11970 [Bacteroidota bacterium]
MVRDKPKTQWFLVWQMVRVSLTVQFKKSFLGLTWLFLAPIFAIIVWVVLHGAGVITPGETSIPYPAYVLISMSIWGFFADAYFNMSNVLSNNARILLTTSCPVQVLIIERVIVQLIRFSIPMVFNIIVLLVFGVDLHLLGVLFPLVIIPLLVFGIAIGLVVSLFRIVAIDLAKIMDQAIHFLMFLTPIIYAPKLDIPWIGSIVKYNPLTYLIGVPRDVLTIGGSDQWSGFFWCSLISGLFLGLSYFIFSQNEKKTLERLINN